MHSNLVRFQGKNIFFLINIINVCLYIYRIVPNFENVKKKKQKKNLQTQIIIY